MRLYITLIFIITIFISTTSRADIIRDSEIEEAINLVAAPIIFAAKLKSLKIYLINDDNLNAFTVGGEEIYIYSGLINRFPDIDVLRGVIAHEVGHIIGKHIARRAENADIYSKVALSSVAVGLLAAASGKAPLEGAIAIAAGGAHFADRSIMAYSRTYESSADQTALKLLEKSGHTSKGMIDFFEYMNKQQRGIFVNPYDQTHPLSNERLVALRNYYQNSHARNGKNSPELEYKFARSAAKLLAFTTDPRRLLGSNISSYSPEILDYIKAICYFRTGDLSNALNFINKLLAQKPSDAYFHELKGQILFEFGKKESLKSYDIAYKLIPNDSLIKLSRAIVGITIFSNQPSQLQQFYNDLKFVLDKEPDNLITLYYMAIYYDKIGDKTKSMLYSATLALKTGDLKRAKSLARSVIKNLPPHTPDWYKANDIILTEE